MVGDSSSRIIGNMADMCYRQWCFPTGSAALIRLAAGPSRGDGDGRGPCPRLGTTPIASGLQSLARRVMTSASWPIPCLDGPGTVNLAAIRVILDTIDPPTGRLQAPTEGCIRHDGLLAMAQARLSGPAGEQCGAVAGLDLLDWLPPSRRLRRRVLEVCHSDPERGVLRRVVAMLIACDGTGNPGHSPNNNHHQVFCAYARSGTGPSLSRAE
jgi:hypothetical protein